MGSKPPAAGNLLNCALVPRKTWSSTFSYGPDVAWLKFACVKSEGCNNGRERQASLYEDRPEQWIRAIPALGFGTLIPDPMATRTATKAALETGFRQLDAQNATEMKRKSAKQC